MPEKRVRRSDEPVVEPDLTSQTPHELARGSAAAVSQPRHPSRAPLSAFQLPEAVRISERSIAPPAATPTAERTYLVAVLGLLLCIVLVLVFLLLA